MSLFVSRDECKSIVKLKSQAYKTNVRPISLDFLTQEQLSEEGSKENQENSIKSLKDSPSLFSKLKGYGMEAFDGVKHRSQDILLSYKDRLPNHSFFNPDLRISDSIFKKTNDLNRFNQTASGSNKEEYKNAGNVKLSDHDSRLIDEYYKSLDRSSALYSIVLSESESNGKEKKFQPHFNDWQKACAERNKAAYALTRSFEHKKIKETFSSSGANAIFERSHRHEKVLAKTNCAMDLETRLRSNLDRLLFNLFPDGPTRVERNALRFGSKGSLKVDTVGSDYGRFYDFENGLLS